jgi:antitoxin Phd
MDAPDQLVRMEPCMTSRRGPAEPRQAALRATRAKKARRAGRGGDSRPHRVGDLPGWKLEDAKARFSELVRRARSEGPQRVTVRGEDAVVVIDAHALEQLLPGDARLPFVPFMESLHVEGLDLTREPDLGRDIEL